MSGGQSQVEDELKNALKSELKVLKDDVLGAVKAEVRGSEQKILRVIKTENRKVLRAIANVALTSPTLSMFNELKEKFDRYLAKN